ncbi:MAG TPA: hypothetical protein VJB14_01500 [Planctomycetota bacterium]|nr:hypothetical protein [Planctomycetota bacterium]
MAKRTGLILAALLAGCGGDGVTFVGQMLNHPIPSELLERTVFKSVGAYREHLDQLVGLLLTVDDGPGAPALSEQNITVRYLAKGSEVEEKSDPVIRYESKVDRGLSAEGNYLAFAASLSAEQKAEVVVTDVASAFAEEVPWDLLARAPVPVGKKAYWVRGVTLTTVAYKTYQKQAAKASVSGGAFGVSGDVYASADRFSLDYRIGVNLIPVSREIAKALPRFTVATKVKADDLTRHLRSAEAAGLKRLTGTQLAPKTLPKIPTTRNP